ncbi:MAG: molecular chaperone DjlA, partial [Prevotella sp.]|nr:molecular chaperone DjlA [Prevotella sp.]
MAAGKWLGGFLGFITGGPLGALAGFVLGSIFDFGLNAVNDQTVSENRYSSNKYQNDFQDRYSTQQIYEGQRNSFLFSLLVLTSYIINADGKVMHSEMELVRNFLRTNFGESSVSQG